MRAQKNNKQKKGDSNADRQWKARKIRKYNIETT